MNDPYFHWNVDPEIIHFIGPFGLRWYSLLFLLGFTLGVKLFADMLKKEKKNEALLDPLLYYTVFGTVIGARLGHCLFYDPWHYLTHPIEILQTWEGGLASHGGYLGILIAALLFVYKYQSKNSNSLSFIWIADRFGIASVLAGAFIRLGNLFNSEIIGRPSDVPWAVIFDRIDQVPRHPSQLYEAVGYLLISAFLYAVYILDKRKPKPGKLLGLAFILNFTFRFFVESFKENQMDYESTMNFNMGQYLSVPFVILGFFLVFGYYEKIFNKSKN